MPNKGTVNNPTGKGFKPNKKGERRGGRQTGTLNTVTSDLKDDLLTAAEELGFPKVMPILDANGEPTGETELIATAEQGRVGFLKWLGLHYPAAFASLLGRVIPLQVNMKKTEPRTVDIVKYPSHEEARRKLREHGFDPDVIEAARKPKFLTHQ